MFNYQDEIQRRKTLGSDNPLIKELPVVIDVEDLRQQVQQQQEERLPTPVYYQSEEEYHSGSEQGLTPPNESENNPLINMTFDANAAQVLTLALTNLNMTLAGDGRENKSVNYSTFSERGDEDIDDFMSELAKAFAIN